MTLTEPRPSARSLSPSPPPSSSPPFPLPASATSVCLSRHHRVFPRCPRVPCAASGSRAAMPARVPPSSAGQSWMRGPPPPDGLVHQAPRNLITTVIGVNTMHTARFSSRKGPDDDTAIIVFQAEAVAAWFVATWNANPRIGYEVCAARGRSLND
ncbi:hypothetical protein B0H17DRAFT_1208818 [Mycena rosella]|uniref:Uncharacterized protein n=1 Tax=Mycena rosella TaxID=1033263 RepID=A0AAD7GAT5_MYCRO|nr:hypothetical protein B0H17DRAFT_1208818 [Mycena rosella]